MQKVFGLFGVKEDLYLFGIMKTSPYDNGEVEALPFEHYKQFHNEITKDKIIKHINNLEVLCSAAMASYDIVTGQSIAEAGFYRDGSFVFPTDFLHYLKNYDIGIPYEYEEYLKGKITAGRS